MAKYTVTKATKELSKKEQYAIAHSSVEGLKDNVPMKCIMHAVVGLRIEPTGNDDFETFDQFVLITDKGLFGTSSEALIESFGNMAAEFGEEFDGTEVYIHYKQSKKNANRKYLVADVVM